MLVKLNNRLQQTADRLNDFQDGIEDELRLRAQITGSYGIESANGQDIDNAEAACAVIVNATTTTSIDVLAGRVIFKNGEVIEVGGTDIFNVAIDPSITDAQLVRLEYGEKADGDVEVNPYYAFAAQPKTVKKNPLEMLVVETVTAYNAQTQTVKDNSVVLGVVRYTDGDLVTDNGRDTYSFSRPWYSPKDVEHRSMVGSGLVTDTNPHGTSPNDLTLGNYTMWQALVGQPSCVVARPTGVGRIPGSVCTETIPGGNFLTDTTGRVTGKAGALYSALGFWPERLLSAVLTAAPNTEVAAWIPKGRNVVAVFDPLSFPAAASIDVVYTKVDAGSLPGSVIGLTSLEVSDPNEQELLVAGGNIYTALSSKQVFFTDVGLVPMSFDIMVGSDGKAYKRPDCIYCNTKLDTLGATAQPFTIQPKAASRLRFAISNYNPGFTEVRFQVTGTDEDGASITEQVVFTGPLAAPAVSFTEVTAQRKFTSNIFATATQVQVINRNGDGPNTTVTIFAEDVPDRPTAQDDLLLATVHWDGSQISANYVGDANIVLDRRLVTRGGGHTGLSPIGWAQAFQTDLNGTVLSGFISGPAVTSNYATVLEDFQDPQWFRYPSPDDQFAGRPIDLPSNSVGIRYDYVSRKIPLAFASSPLTPTRINMMLIPSSHRWFPNFAADLNVQVTFYPNAGAPVVRTGTIAGNPWPPYQVTFSNIALPGVVNAVQVSIRSNTPGNKAALLEMFQGFALYLR